MSLFAEYIKERTDKDILENDKGFATYYFINDSCYIEDIYVKPEFRQSGEASNLANEIVKIAKDKQCNRLIGSVVPSAKGSTSSLKVLLAYGFQLDSSLNDFIVMSKVI